METGGRPGTLVAACGAGLALFGAGSLAFSAGGMGVLLQKGGVGEGALALEELAGGGAWMVSGALLLALGLMLVHGVLALRSHLPAPAGMRPVILTGVCPLAAVVALGGALLVALHKIPAESLSATGRTLFALGLASLVSIVVVGFALAAGRPGAGLRRPSEASAFHRGLQGLALLPAALAGFFFFQAGQLCEEFLPGGGSSATSLAGLVHLELLRQHLVLGLTSLFSLCSLQTLLAWRLPLSRPRRKILQEFLTYPCQAPFLMLVRCSEWWIGRTQDAQRAFFPRENFPWIAEVEKKWRAVRQELDALLMDLESVPDFQVISKDQAILTRDHGWKTFFLEAYGLRVEANRRRCPKTLEVLQHIPGVKTAMFSILASGKHIPPHRGVYKGVLRLHLGLLVPVEKELCQVRVKGELASWEEGRCLVFDDSFEHEAWNHSDELRVVLFVDFLRPLPGLLGLWNRLAVRLLRLSPLVRDFKRGQARWLKRLALEGRP